MGIVVDDVSLAAYAQSIGKTSTANLTFGDLLGFENYITGYKPQTRKEQHHGTQKRKKGSSKRQDGKKGRGEEALRKILNAD